jgi:ADP-heptose:LPS heptosyltransferase
LKKILIIRFSSIGDIVLTSPVLRCLKLQRPDIEIHYLTKKSFGNILKNNHYVTRTHTIEKDVNEVIDELKKENFDEIIDLHNNLRSLEIKIKLRKPSSTFKKKNLQKWMIVNLKKRDLFISHVVDRYLETVTHFGVKNDGLGLDYFIPSEDEVNINSLPVSHQNGFIGFVIGAKHFTKQLPEEKIISICKRIDQPIVLLGGKEDADRALNIQKAIGSNIFIACGKYNLNQSASLVKQAKRIISHDTGLMHIAAALKKDIISVWGNTVPAFGFTPYSPGINSKIVEVNDLPCRPCSKIGYDACPLGHFKCMNDIEESEF